MAINLLTTAQACAALGGLNRSTVTRWVQLGRMRPAARLDNGHLLFTPEEIERARRELLHKTAENAE